MIYGDLISHVLPTTAGLVLLAFPAMQAIRRLADGVFVEEPPPPHVCLSSHIHTVREEKKPIAILEYIVPVQ